MIGGMPDSRLFEICPPDVEAAEGASGEEVGGEGGTLTTCASYEPHPKQAAFHDSLAPRKAGICGVGFGKTVMGVWEMFQRVVVMNWDRPSVALVGAPSFPHMRDNVLPVYEAMWGAEDTRACLAGGSWSTAFQKGSHCLKIANGARILFRSIGPGQEEKIRGPQFSFFQLDEARLLKSDLAWRTGLGRLRYPGVRYRGAWLTTTTDGENWVWERFIANPKDTHFWIHATTYENPRLAQDYVRNLETDYSEEDIAQELLAEIVSRRGAVYKHLSHEEWPRGNALSYTPNKAIPVRLEVDFGYRSPRCHAVQRLEIREDEKAPPRTVDCVVWEWQDDKGKVPRDRTIDDMVEAIKSSGFQVSIIYGDPSGDSANSMAHVTEVDKLKAAFRVNFIVPAKDWQTSIENGERTVRARIRDGNGDRWYLWAVVPGRKGPGDRPIFYAGNSFQAHRNLRYPEPGEEAPEKTTSLKDGINDHDCDATRYHLVMRYGRDKRRRPLQVSGSRM